MRRSPVKPKSLYRELTMTLIAVVSMVAIVVGVLEYVYAVQRQAAQFDRAVERYETDLHQLLELPLWNVDDALVEKIGSAISTNADLAFVAIRDENERIIYRHGKQDGELITRDIMIKHHG
ncbi:MAG: hypothetical protein OEY86_19560, partial [Nitrospira sp.]|nr:hypothetical protein [Nitrospira sp.]